MTWMTIIVLMNILGINHVLMLAHKPSANMLFERVGLFVRYKRRIVLIALTCS